MANLYSPQRILILSSSTGGGHNSAALALEESFLRLSTGGALVHIRQVLEDSHFLTRHLASFYNYLLRYHQHYMRYYYGAINRLKPYESHMLFQLSLKYGLQLIEKVAPTKLVSVHPMTQHFFAYLLKKLRLIDKIPLITVVTDPCEGFWQGWACDEVSQYFVASEEAKAQLLTYGIHENRIQISGMPIHAKFKPVSTQPEKWQLRQALQLEPERFTILVNTGWVGGGNVLSMYEALMQMPASSIQVAFLAGKNEAMRLEAERLSAKAPFPVKVFGFTDDIQHLMNASDLMISKLGGLTTFEAMACHLPIIGDCLTPPMPQEEGTARFIEEKGAGILVKTPHEMLETVTSLSQNPTQYMALKAATAQVGRPGAVDQITQAILYGG